MNLFTPCPVEPGMMEKSEAEVLDVLTHLLAPDLVVEIGRAQGHSARIFARHAKVISLDRNPPLPIRLLPEENVVQLVGCSPGDLHLVAQEPWFMDADNKRVLFFHDSDHYADVLVPEVEWAFKHRCFAAIGHDAGLIGPQAEKRGSMPDALDRLRKLGRRVLRVSDQGTPTSTEEVSTGLWLSWPS